MSEARTVRATVEYDGAGFHGFQRQRSARTVQGELESAILAAAGAEVTVAGAGRTDSGVHALGQVIAFRIDTRLDDATLLRAVNAHLPSDVAIRQLTTAACDFDPRRDATSRIYEYRIEQRPVRPVLDRCRAWHIAQPLDLAQMRCAAARLVGSHDFDAFTAGPQEGTRREVFALEVWREGTSIFVRIAANAFLYRMVRRVVAMLVRVGRGEIDAASVASLLRPAPRAEVRGAAPAHGLTLMRVEYSGAQRRYNQERTKQAVLR
ncbi:MAG: tRNA pseudouridine(38-40) synthase TruA [Chloroflexota bacterium]|nr:tRNA pseudouridine(38-40) synthase TruA [Chloroflexota bacterium]